MHADIRIAETGIGKRIVCPDCGSLEPVDGYVTCGQCGLGIDLQAETHVNEDDPTYGPTY